VFTLLRYWAVVSGCVDPADALPGSSAMAALPTPTAAAAAGPFYADLTAHPEAEVALVRMLRAGALSARHPDAAAADALGHFAALQAATTRGLGGAAVDSGPAAALLPPPLPPTAAAVEARALRTAVLRPPLLPRLCEAGAPSTAALLSFLHPDPTPEVLAAVMEPHPEVAFRYLRIIMRRLGALPPRSGGLDGDDDEDVEEVEASVSLGSGAAGGGPATALLPPGTLFDGGPTVGLSGGGGGGGPQAPPDHLHLRYVGLLCRFRPRSVTRYLAHGAGTYPLDATLAAVRSGPYGNPEATAYLLERTGDIRGALSLMLTAVGAALRTAHAALLAAASASGAASAAPLDATAAGEADAALLAAVPRDAQAVAAAVASAVALCARNAARGIR
jgi:hypothetical protein